MIRKLVCFHPMMSIDHTAGGCEILHQAGHSFGNYETLSISLGYRGSFPAKCTFIEFRDCLEPGFTNLRNMNHTKVDQTTSSWLKFVGNFWLIWPICRPSVNSTGLALNPEVTNLE